MVLVQVETYEVQLNIYIAKITNLTLLIKLMEDDPDSYSELQLEEVNIKIKQVEALIVELQASIQTTSAVLITIREQVTVSEPLLKTKKGWVDKANLQLLYKLEFDCFQNPCSNTKIFNYNFCRF